MLRVDDLWRRRASHTDDADRLVVPMTDVVDDLSVPEGASEVAPEEVPYRRAWLRRWSPRQVASAWRLAGASLGLPLALYIVLRPENYGLTPNGLDPVFYSGYAINFDGVMKSVGDRYYFVSRWSVYYPTYIADAIAGPFVGRLLWRLVVASAILCALWSLGRRFAWSRAQQFLVGTLVLAMPFFVRAFFTDYTEHVVVAAGICLICLCLRQRHSARIGLVMGALVGLILVANPIAISVVAPCTIVAVIMSHSWRARFVLCATVATGAIAVIVGGLLLFRWRYGINNVYKPTIDFIKTYKTQIPDQWKDNRLLWLGNFTWLYAPPILIIGAVSIARVRKITFHRAEIAALVLCGVQYAFQWLDQFVRGAYGLELSFYWAYMYPTFAVALALVVARLTKGCRERTLVALGLGWILFMFVGVPHALRLPSGWVFAAVAFFVLAMIAAVAKRWSVLATVILIGIVGWTQIGSPLNDLTAHKPIDVAPYYDRLFREGGDASEVEYQEAVWFTDEMHRVPNNANTAFVPVGGVAGSIIGIYAPHPLGKVVTTNADATRLTAIAISEVKSGLRPVFAVYGPPPNVATMVATFPRDLGVGTQILDVTHHGALGYRLVVFSMPDSSRLPFTYTADSLGIAQGHVVGTAVKVDSTNAPGFVTFGPFKYLTPSTHQVTLRYSSTADPSVAVGLFDIASPEDKGTASTPLTGTNGKTETRTLTFTVSEKSRWEFRTRWAAIGEMTIESFTLLP